MLVGMSTSEDASLLTVPQVAAKLNVSRSTAWRLVHSGELPARRIGSHRGSPIRVDPGELAAFVESHPAGKAADFPRPPRGGLEEKV
jgi:excisionase family DNA binding protein